MAKTPQVKRPRSEEGVQAAAERAEIMRSWMSSHIYNGKPVSQGALIRMTGLPESVVVGMLARSGRNGDVGALRGYNVVKLLRGMRLVDPDLTGESVARMLKVREDRLERWLGAETRELLEDGEMAVIPHGMAWLNNPDREPFEQLAARTAVPMDPMMATAVRAAVDTRGYSAAERKRLTEDRVWIEPLRHPLQGSLSAPAGWQVTVTDSAGPAFRLWQFQGLPWALPAAAEFGLGWTEIGFILSLSEK